MTSSSPSITPPLYQILLVDDHPIIRQGLAQIIDRESDLQICGEAATLTEALGVVDALTPDLAVVDLMLEGGSGLDLIQSLHIRLPALPILVISMHDERLYAERVLRAGARGYIMKRELTDTIRDAIRRVIRGELVFSERFFDALGLHPSRGDPHQQEASLAQLSDRELEVFQYLRQGHSRRYTAEMLQLDEAAVNAYCTNILSKLRLEDLTELARYAQMPNPESGSADASRPKATRYQFANYLLDTTRRELERDGMPIPLEPKVYQVLVYLLQHADRLVTREELLEHVWPDIFVQDAVLARCIRAIRQALNDDHTSQRMIQTRPRQGYRFVAPVVNLESLKRRV
jgi:DNA-binding NarL/FixJ family response regulator/DNA-binding winged helix-turn-helix (wHTH) protein